MKIVGFEEFTKLPIGTIYSYYEPCIVTGLYRKLETINDEDGRAIDFFEISLVAECTMSEPPSLDEAPSR